MNWLVSEATIILSTQRSGCDSKLIRQLMRVYQRVHVDVYMLVYTCWCMIPVWQSMKTH